MAAVLRDGTADLAFLHSPWEDLSGFDSEPLPAEGGVAVLPAGHRLADRPFLRLADLDDDPTPRWPGSGAGVPRVAGAAVMLQPVALGRLVGVVPESVRDQVRRDLVCVPVLDAARTTVVLAWPERTRSRAVAAFVHTATAVASRMDGPG